MTKHIPCELSIIMPCLNEAETIGVCIDKAKNFLKRTNINGEIIIADNGSIDNSVKIAKEKDARVVHIKEKGYGSALMGGINAALSDNIIMGDSDDSYDFSNLDPFYLKLTEGYDLVMGNRFKGGIEKKAMPFLHKYLGNPVLTKIGQLFFKSPCGDFHCGLRGFKKSAIKKLDLCTTGMEFASEMVVKSSLYNMKITEVATTLSCDGRNRPAHLRTWQDGWRHLRFMLVYSPNWLFLYPGIFLLLLGCFISIAVLPGPVTILNLTFDIHTLLFASMFTVLGVQSILFAVISKTFCITEGLMPMLPSMKFLYKYIKLETGLTVGIILIVLGISGSFFTFGFWGLKSFGNLASSTTMRFAIPSVTMLTIGVQIFMTSFLLSLLGMKRK